MVNRYHEESGHPIWIYKKLSSTSSGHLENIESSRAIAQSSNKLRQIQEISLLQSLYPSLGQRIPKLLFADNVRNWTLWHSPCLIVCESLKREKIVDGNFFQYRSTEKRSESV